MFEIISHTLQSFGCFSNEERILINLNFFLISETQFISNTLWKKSFRTLIGHLMSRLHHYLSLPDITIQPTSVYWFTLQNPNTSTSLFVQQNSNYKIGMKGHIGMTNAELALFPNKVKLSVLYGIYKMITASTRWCNIAGYSGKTLTRTAIHTGN